MLYILLLTRMYIVREVILLGMFYSCFNIFDLLLSVFDCIFIFGSTKHTKIYIHSAVTVSKW